MSKKIYAHGARASPNNSIFACSDIFISPPFVLAWFNHILRLESCQRINLPFVCVNVLGKCQKQLILLDLNHIITYQKLFYLTFLVNWIILLASI